MYVVTPTYFRPMFESVVGWLLVSILATASFMAYALAEVGIWSFRKGRLLRLTLTATTYRLTHDPACGGLTSLGEVVVNKAEIDFFNADVCGLKADVCGLKLPEGVGRYGWTLNGGVLHFTALNPDPCPRGAAWFDNRSYSRT